MHLKSAYQGNVSLPNILCSSHPLPSLTSQKDREAQGKMIRDPQKLRPPHQGPRIGAALAGKNYLENLRKPDFWTIYQKILIQCV